MFMGEYNHTIDAKGRLIIPAKFRELLGEEFVLTKGLDGCLSIYPMDGQAGENSRASDASGVCWSGKGRGFNGKSEQD